MPANIFGDQGNSVKVFWIKGIKGTIGFINGEQEIKGSWENVPPPPPQQGLIWGTSGVFGSIRSLGAPEEDEKKIKKAEESK